MKFKLKIKIIENRISLFLLDEEKKNIARTEWNDNRNLSEKLLGEIDLLLKRRKIPLKNISEFDFVSSDRCGFSAGQIGEITAKVLNFGNSNDNFKGVDKNFV